MDRVRRGLEIDPAHARGPKLVAAKRVRDDPIAIEPEVAQLLAQLADDRAQRDGPGGRQRFPPEQFRQLRLGNRAFAFHHEVDQRQAPLPARKIRFAQELLAPLDRDLAGEVNPQRGIAKHLPNPSSHDLRHPGRSFEEVRNAKARRVRVRLGPADRR